jgi:hypothetical protein
MTIMGDDEAFRTLAAFGSCYASRRRRFNLTHIRLKLAEALLRMTPTEVQRKAMPKVRIDRAEIEMPKLEAAI